MRKFINQLTELQQTTILELFENDSIKNKLLEIPIQFNLKYNKKYS